MEKISRTVYPLDAIDINSWFKEFRIGILVEKTNTQARDMMALWKDNEGNKNDFKEVIQRLAIIE